MRVLYLTHRVPYPPNKGDKIRTYHHIRRLANSCDVHLLSFIDRPEDEQWRTVLERHCRQVEFVRLHRSRALARGVFSLLQQRSLTEGYSSDAAMWRALRRVTAAHTFDVAWASSSGMAQYLPFVPASRRIADFHDVDSEKWRQFAQHARAPLRWVYQVESYRLRQFEMRVGAAVDWVLFVSEPEAALFRSFTMGRVQTRAISNGVDTTFFHPTSAPAIGPRANILFTGTLDYRPNIDAVQFFVREVLPRVRADVVTAQFSAVGHRPARRLLRSVRSSRDCVKIVGSVPDIRPYFAAAHIAVAPMRLGRGIQNKILEAMAMGVPVVATPLAVEGLAIENGVHVLVAETAGQFAAAVSALLRDTDRCRGLVENALRLVQRQYRSELTVQGIDALLPEAFVPAAHSRP